MLKLDNLSKSYGDHVVFQGLNQTFSPGCIALCEEESTGKSSLLAIIAGELSFDSGDVWIDGHSMRHAAEQAKARLAYVPDNTLARPMQTGREHLEQVAREKNTRLDDSILDLASRLGLAPHIDKRFEQMSTGTRRKVYLTAAALGDPAVVIADGPSNGLDAQASAVLAEQFKAWARDRVILFASFDTTLIQTCDARSVNVSELR